MTQHDPEPDDPEPDDPESGGSAPDAPTAFGPASAPEPAQTSGSEPAADAAPVRPSARRWWWTGLIVLAVLVGGTVAGATGVAVVQLLREDTPEVGDCLPQEAVDGEIEIVDCGEGAAHWEVIGHDGGWTRGEFAQASEDEVCADHPETQQALWVTPARDVSDGTEGEVVCLAPLAR